MPAVKLPVVNIAVNCRVCKKPHILVVNEGEFKRWKGGEGLVGQDLFLNLSSGQRELLISKTCGVCWQKMFAEEED